MTRRLPDAVELAAAAAGAFHFVPVATWFETAAAAGTSYAAAAPADADAATAAADAATAAPACAGAGCAFGGASATRREADCPVRRGRYLDGRQRPLEACNWHRRSAWTDVRWGLTCVPYDPYRSSETSTYSRPCRPSSRAPADAGSKPRSACRSGCTGETSGMACPVDRPLSHNGGQKLLDVTNSDRTDRQLAEIAAEPIVIAAEAPVRPHRSAADADADVPPRHFAGPGCTNSRNTNSCYCSRLSHLLISPFPRQLLTDFLLVVLRLMIILLSTVLSYLRKLTFFFVLLCTLRTDIHLFLVPLAHVFI